MQLPETTKQFSVLQNALQINPLLPIFTAILLGQVIITLAYNTARSSSFPLSIVIFHRNQSNIFKKADRITVLPCLNTFAFLMSSHCTQNKIHTLHHDCSS
jgi:hypothetical protein